MEILEAGKLPEKEKPVWTGMRIRCPKCKTLIEFGEDDKLTTKRQYGMNGPISYNCPTKDCETEILFDLPKIATPPLTRAPVGEREIYSPPVENPLEKPLQERFAPRTVRVINFDNPPRSGGYKGNVPPWRNDVNPDPIDRMRDEAFKDKEDSW